MVWLLWYKENKTFSHILPQCHGGKSIHALSQATSHHTIFIFLETHAYTPYLLDIHIDIFLIWDVENANSATE